MRRASQVFVHSLAVIAVVLLSGCRRTEMRRCVDMQNMVVAEELCRVTGEQRILGQRPRPAGSYRYYYGGEGSHEAGTLATGGDYLPADGHSYETIQIKRVGFSDSRPIYMMVVVAVMAGVLWLRAAGKP
jgi:hypothetical protein